MHSRAAEGVPAVLPDHPRASKVDKDCGAMWAKDNVLVLDVTVNYRNISTRDTNQDTVKTHQSLWNEEKQVRRLFDPGNS